MAIPCFSGQDRTSKHGDNDDVVHRFRLRDVSLSHNSFVFQVLDNSGRIDEFMNIIIITERSASK